MKRNIIGSLVLLTVLLPCTSHCLAQQNPFAYYGHVEPQQISFGKPCDFELFQQYLSSFSCSCNKDKCSLYVNFVNEHIQKELDSAFWEFAFMVPGFKVFPAFRLDCEDGYVVALYHTYHSVNVEICNLDVISYDRHGRFLERTTFPLHQTGYFYTQDSCNIAFQSKGGVLNIENGVAVFMYDSSRCCTPEMASDKVYSHSPKNVVREKQEYVYMIGDNACLVPVSESEINNE